MLAISHRARWALAVLLVVSAAACGRTDAPRDVEDPSPPRTTLSAAGTLGHAGFVDVADGAWLRVAHGAQVTLRATASDPDGVSRVELRVTEILVCPTGMYATSRGAPPLVPAPASSTNGTVTPISAPSSLTTSVVIETVQPPVGCVAQWDVRAAATNAARRPVGASGPHARFGIDALMTAPRRH